MTNTRKIMQHIVLGGVACLALICCGSRSQMALQRAQEHHYQQRYTQAEQGYRKLYRQLETAAKAEAKAATNSNMKADTSHTALHSLRRTLLQRLAVLNAQQLHNPQQAIADYSALAQHFPHSEAAFEAWVAIATLYRTQLQQPKAAITTYRTLIAAFPQHARTPQQQLKLINLYITQHQHDHAMRAAQDLAASWPDTPQAQQALFHIAMLQATQGHYQQAKHSLQQLLNHNMLAPTAALKAQALFALGHCLQDLGDSDGALAQYHASLAEHPQPALVQHKIMRLRARLQALRHVGSIHAGSALARH